MLPPGINFIKANNVFFALLHDYATHRYKYYKTILPWFQKQFLLKKCLMFLGIITICLIYSNFFYCYSMFFFSLRYRFIIRGSLSAQIHKVASFFKAITFHEVVFYDNSRFYLIYKSEFMNRAPRMTPRGFHTVHSTFSNISANIMGILKKILTLQSTDKSHPGHKKCHKHRPHSLTFSFFQIFYDFVIAFFV